MNKKNKLIIIGAGETAQMAYEYFKYDSDYEVCVFSAEDKFISDNNLFGVPVVALETLEAYYPPEEFHAFVALGYGELNRNRARLVDVCKEKGYSMASYVSSRAFVWRNVTIGENCFILENNTLQYNVKIGDNVVLWSGNHIGHRSVIGSHCFISSQVVISGFCAVGEYSFLGVNSCVADNVTIAKDCVISAGAVVLADTEIGKVYQGNPAQQARVSSYRIFNVKGLS